MNITVCDLQKKVRINPAEIIKITKIILKHQKIKAAELSLVFVSHQKIRALNQKYLRRNYGTDVLAFDLSDEKIAKKAQTSLFGDIIISTDAALKSMRSFRTTIDRELALYVAHGILHLKGYDDHKPNDTAKMRAEEARVMAHLGEKTRSMVRLKPQSKA